MAASSIQAWLSFLRAVDIETLELDEPLPEVLDVEEARLLCCALQHRKVEGANFSDPYFMEEEIAALTRRNSDHLKMAQVLLCSDEKDTQSKARFLSESKVNSLCACEAHSSADDELYRNVIRVLVTIQPPLSDNSGNVMDSYLLTHTMKKSKLDAEFHPCMRGRAVECSVC